ncbi:hypothetical protein [Microbacterium sp. PMB16]|uniref:hypothetical protein n=1 Tax=Microbacterium sp. PMB16 TaxID=3120157 RepID=UPI003F4C9758
MNEIASWVLLAVVFAMVPGLLIFGFTHTFSRKPVEEKYENATAGGLGGAFDAVWSPTAHEADQERDRQTQRTAPAPAPGDPLRRIDGDRIVIDI